MAQIVQIRNPLQSLDLRIPEEGEIFKTTGEDYNIFKRSGTGFQVLDRSQFKGDFSSLPEYNRGDITTGFQQLFPGFNANTAFQKSTDPSAFLTTQPIATDQTFQITPKQGEFTVEGKPITPETFIKPGTLAPQLPQFPTPTPQLTAQTPQVQKIQQEIEQAQKTAALAQQQKTSDIAAGKPQTFQVGTSTPVEPSQTKNLPSTTTITPETTQQSSIVPSGFTGANFNDLFSQLGVSTQNKIEDVVKTISKQYGFEDINKEIEKIDNQQLDEIAAVNDNPWLSETLRSKKATNIKEKFEKKKEFLIDRLKLSGDIVGQAIKLYENERNFQQENFFRALSLRETEIERQRKISQQEFENKISLEKLGLERKRLTERRQDTTLSPSEAALLGVPFGTTEPEAAAMGIIPQISSQLGVEATKTKENALSGLRALETIEQELKSVGRLKLIGRALPFDPGARILATASREAADVITRLRTGAALNEGEERFYRKQLPGVFDSHKTIQYKLGVLRNLFSRLSTQRQKFPNIIIQSTPKDSNYLKELGL